MSRIKESLINKKSFVGFLTAGDPSLQKTEDFVVALEQAGASLVEIGIPFSDPIAEDTAVQDASLRALSSPEGCKTEMIFRMLERLMKKVTIPVVLLTYLNPVYCYGYEAFMKRCKETGVSGVVLPDLPYEEKEELSAIAKNCGVEIISMIAPAPKERIQMIAKEAEGFLYMIPHVAPWEGRKEVLSCIREMTEQIREVTDIPVIVDYEISTPEDAKEFTEVCDGVMIGGTVFRLIGEHGAAADSYLKDYAASVVECIS